MVKNASMVLKIGMHSPFGPKFPVEFEHFDKKVFGQAYWGGLQSFFTSVGSEKLLANVLSVWVLSNNIMGALSKSTCGARGKRKASVLF